ncbi:hypothetical protein ACHAWX_003216 [Stephanocyclus meneghinianus]
MNHIRNLLLGDSNEGNAASGGRRESTNSDSQYANPPNSRHHQQSNPREGHSLQDDLYLSDDDDWGMSALSATQSSLKRPNAYQDHRSGMSGFDHYTIGNTDRSREIFWDQNSVTGNEAGKLQRGADRKVAGEMQSWEKASMYQDSLNDAFQIGDDDYYHSDQRSLEENKKAYDEVQEDIRSVEEEQEEEGADDDNKEEVANAYRDYLKSIREGGFESYLNNEDDVETTDFDNIYGDEKNTPVLTNKKGSKSYQENVLEIEEDRSLYGNLYGIRDMRAQVSPYSSWRAKAQALVDYDNKRQRGPSPVRAGIERFRRKGALNVEDGLKDFEDEMVSRGRSYSYSQPFFHNQRFKRFCFCSVLMLAIIVGLYNSVGTRSQQESSQMAIPPKNEASYQQHNDPQLYLPPNSNNAIANTLKTFDPVWYNRRSGWEGITFIDAVNFCKSKQKRVPCSYELYCNEGPGLPPYEGVKTNGEQWAAISNGPNQWVQVGAIDNDPSSTCKTYKQIHLGLPDWGITGISKEHAHGAGGITQNLMCCVDANHLESGWWKPDLDEDADSAETSNAPANAAEDTTDEMNVPSDGNAAVASSNNKVQQREKAVISAFQPVWFATSHGWSGTTYDDAIDFCASYNHMVLCPFSAYCPNGPRSPPLSGSMVLDIDGEEWAPVNGPLNSWVQLGKINGDPATQCALHHDLLGNRPQWGVDGSRPEIKHHVMCCLM